MAVATPPLPAPMKAAAALALVALFAPAPARAQLLPIEPGQAVEAVLSSSDPTPSAKGPFKVYRFQARKGDRFTATMRSAEFDSYLRLAREVGGITDPLVEDDDADGDGDARLRFTAPDDGAYLLIAQSLEEDGSGAFTLTLERAPTPTTAEPRRIRVGETPAGELAETDAVQEDDGSYYDTWTVAGRRGERLVVVLESAAFDAFVSIGSAETGGDFAAIASNDDGDQAGDGTNARLRVRIPETGMYDIRVNSIGTGTGPYRLSLLAGPEPPVTAGRQPVTAGEEVRGRLDPNDAVLDNDSYYEYWLYRGSAGERLKIRMASTEFDTFVAFGRLVGGAFAEIVSNDDGPNGMDSEIEITLTRDGDYAIRASALGAGLAGDYTLAVTRAR